VSVIKDEQCEHPVEAYLHKAETLFGRKVTGAKLHRQDKQRPAPVFSPSAAGKNNFSIAACVLCSAVPLLSGMIGKFAQLFFLVK
jgi:hypothetical protein